MAENPYRVFAISGDAGAAPGIVSPPMEPASPATRYRVSLHRARGAWFARVIDLPGCVGHGATEVEALENARGVIRTYLQIARLLSVDPARIVLEISA